MLNTNTLKIENLSKSFKKNFWNKPEFALKNVSLEIESGQVIGLIGPNGSGKTTLLKTIMGYLHPANGHISFDGAPVFFSNTGLVGYIPEKPEFYGFLTGEDHLKFFSELKNKNYSSEFIETLNLDKVIHKKVGSYSKGYTQRLAIAQALIGEPEIILLDEPFSGLDSFSKGALVSLIEELKIKGKIVILTTHLLETVTSFIDKMAVLDQGELKYFGSPQSFKGVY